MGERRQLEVKDEKKTCPWLIGPRLSQSYRGIERGLPAALKASKHDSGDIKAL